MKTIANTLLVGLAAVCLVLAGQSEAAAQGPRPGVWRMDFVGPSGERAEGRLVLRERDGRTYSGYADWKSDDGGRRREYFDGIYDRRAGTLTLVSKDRRRTPGTVVHLGTYIATVSEDGQEMFDGVWNIPDSPRGKWSAKRIR